MLILFKFEFFCFSIFKDNLLESVHLHFGMKKMFWDRNILAAGCIDPKDILIFENSCDFIPIENEVIFFRTYTNSFLVQSICSFRFHPFVLLVCSGKLHI
ncbi:hypothetical protein C7M16_00189 [Bacillus subtilis]|nr:hypothetical protein C7M16_00189 [Bacillus subtilis]